MSSTNKTNILKLNQYQGLDKPSYLDYNADMSKIDEAMLGWYPISATVVYISDSSVKASSDLTGSISKGMKIKLTQDSVTKYFIVSGVVLQNNETVITLDGQNTYTLTNSAIIEVNFSTQEAPFRFPVNNINDMFNPKLVTNGTDFNTLTTPGWYYCNSYNDCQKNTNMPKKEAFIMQVVDWGGGGQYNLLQIFYLHWGVSFIRARFDWTNPQWQPWQNPNYPVGSIFMSMNSTSPASLFGGLWEPISNCFLWATHDPSYIGDIGGEYNHTLTLAEMPTHVHNDGTGWVITDTSTRKAASGGNEGSLVYSINASYAVGGNKAHNNMPPYTHVMMWKRVA